MFIKIKKLKFINLVLAACILSTTVAPSAQAMGLFGYLKKMVSPSAQTENTENLGIIAPPDDTVDISTAMEVERQEEGSIFNTRNVVNLITVATSLCIVLAIRYLQKKEVGDLKDAPEEIAKEIRETAKELGFSDDEIKKINIKVPAKDLMTNNACYDPLTNTVLILKQTGISLNANVKKFVYGHELSHKKQQKLFNLIFIAIAPLMIYRLYKELKNTKKTTLKELMKILLSAPLSLLLSYSVIGYLKEKDADLGAAKLGTDVIIGGILLFEKEHCEIRMDNDLRKKHSNFINKHSNFINKIKIIINNFLYIAKEKLDPHPSLDTRIAYLEKLLTTEDQKKKLAIERKNLEELKDKNEIKNIVECEFGYLNYLITCNDQYINEMLKYNLQELTPSKEKSEIKEKLEKLYYKKNYNYSDLEKRPVELDKISSQICLLQHIQKEVDKIIKIVIAKSEKPYIKPEKHIA